MSECVCGTLSNTGAPNCPSIMDITKQAVFVSAINASGVPAFITVANAKVFSNIETLLNAGTAIKSRWLPTPELENLTDERGEPVYQEFTSGKRAFVRDGFRTFMAFIPNGDTELLGRLKELGRCNELGAYLLDKSSNLIGSKRNQGVPYTNLYPILIDRSTWYVSFVKAKDTEVQGIMITFQWKSTEEDQDLIMVPSSETNWSREDLYGLLDVYGESVDCGQTSLEVDVYLKTGSSEVEPVTGLVTADFTLYNVTDSASVTVTGCTESLTNEGRYTLTYASQTVSDVLRVGIDKERYDSANAENGLEAEIFTVV